MSHDTFQISILPEGLWLRNGTALSRRFMDSNRRNEYKYEEGERERELGTIATRHLTYAHTSLRQKISKDDTSTCSFSS